MITLTFALFLSFSSATTWLPFFRDFSFWLYHLSFHFPCILYLVEMKAFALFSFLFIWSAIICPLLMIPILL